MSARRLLHDAMLVTVGFVAGLAFLAAVSLLILDRPLFAILAGALGLGLLWAGWILGDTGP